MKSGSRNCNNPGTAAVMNERFPNIKGDGVELPSVDPVCEPSFPSLHLKPDAAITRLARGSFTNLGAAVLGEG